jgi:hypothetical protein
MNKFIFRIVFFYLSAGSLSANAQMEINAGVKGGANFSTFIGEDAEKASALVGPHFGGIVQFSWSGEDKGFLTYVIQPELFFSQQGAKSGSDKTTFSYVNFGTIIQRYIGSSGFYFETGPQVGFLVSAKSKTAGVTRDIKEQIKKTDFSLLAGIGSFEKDYDVHNATIGAGLFYVFGRGRE